MERKKPVETSQPVKEDNLFKHTGFSDNFPIGSTKNMCSIYFLSGITGIFLSMVNNPCVQACFAVLEPDLNCSTFLLCSFFLVSKALPVSPIYRAVTRTLIGGGGGVYSNIQVLPD